MYEKKGAAATATGPTKPVWVSLAQASDGSVTVPANTTFAISSLVSNPNIAALTTALSSAASSNAISPTTGLWPAPPGSGPPVNWPAGDNAGNAATRWSGATGTSGFVLPNANGASVWTVVGFV